MIPESIRSDSASCVPLTSPKAEALLIRLIISLKRSKSNSSPVNSETNFPRAGELSIKSIAVQV